MLFHITQTHTPELCPRDEGGSSILSNPQVEGLTLLATYGAFAEHVIYYVVEAESHEAVQAFLLPGFKRCTSAIRLVGAVPIAS